MKKFLAMAVAIAMVLSLVTVPAFAITQTAPIGGGNTHKDAVSFTAEAPASVQAGEEFAATVSVNGTYEAHGLNLQFNYDAENFEVVGTENGPVMAQIQSLNGMGLLDTSIPGSIRYGVMMPMGGFTESGIIFTVNFRAKADAASGSYNITPVVTEFFTMPIGEPQTDIEFTATGATVQVTGGGTTPTETPTEAPTQAPTEAPTQAPTEAPTQAPTNPPAPGGNATVVLNVPSDIWGDGTGYQMLLDADATAFGSIIPATGTFTGTSYADFEYKIPENADCSASAQYIVINGSVSITVPAGTYDYVINNPDNAGTIWIASDNGTAAGRADDFVFEANKTYTFTVSMGGQNDRVDLEITGGDPGDPTPAPTTAPTAAPSNPPAPGGDATIVLNVPSDVWGDGSGYQMLLDANATAFGSIIPAQGGLTSGGNAPAGMYDEFEYKIPVNADGNLNTANIIVTGSVSITVPAGTYDWCITNPTPGDRIWIASDTGNIPGRYDDYNFEAGKVYTFTVTFGGQNDRVDLTIEDGGPTPAPVTPDPTTPAPVTPDPVTPVPVTPIPDPVTPAPGQVGFWVDAPETVEAGQEFEVSVRVEGEFEAHGLNIQLNYDAENFEITGLTNGPVMTQIQSLNGMGLPDYTTIPGSVRLGVMMPQEPFTENGIIFTVTVKASETIADGDYGFIPVVVEFINMPIGAAATPIDNAAVPAYVHVGAPVTPAPETPAPSDGVTISVPEYTAVPGALVPVTVSIAGDYQAHGLTMYLDYNHELLTAESVENGQLMNDVLAVEGFNILDFESIPGSVRYAAVAPLPEQPFSTEGTVFTVNFRVAADAAVGTVLDLKLNVTEMVYMPDSQDISVDFETADGSITIVEGAPVTAPPTTPPTPPTGTVALVGAGIAAVVAGTGIVLFRKKED